MSSSSHDAAMLRTLGLEIVPGFSDEPLKLPNSWTLSDAKYAPEEELNYRYRASVRSLSLSIHSQASVHSGQSGDSEASSTKSSTKSQMSTPSKRGRNRGGHSLSTAHLWLLSWLRRADQWHCQISHIAFYPGLSEIAHIPVPQSLRLENKHVILFLVLHAHAEHP
jgi:hypothetical protein